MTSAGFEFGYNFAFSAVRIRLDPLAQQPTVIVRPIKIAHGAEARRATNWTSAVARRTDTLRAIRVPLEPKSP